MPEFTDADFRKAVVNLTKATDEVKTIAEKAEKDVKAFGNVQEETKAKADEALVKMNELSARCETMEAELTKRGNTKGTEEVKTVGQQFVESEEYKAASTKGIAWKGRISHDVKTITGLSTTGASTTTGLVVADRQPGLVNQPYRPLVVRDLIMPGRTVSSNIEWVQENVVTNNAATVAENPSAPKPQSDMTYVLKHSPVTTIAHFIMASKQIMADAPQLQSMIDGRLRYGLAYAEDLQLLLGDGTGNNLLGLIPQATAYAKPAGVIVQNATLIDTLRLAMLQATLSLYPATGHVLHPTDLTSIQLTKDTQNRYIYANPMEIAAPTLWGLPVAQSLAMTVGQFLTGAFKMACQIFDREDANISMSTEDRDNFVKNMITILAEERLALVVNRPQALITGSIVPAN